jgi:hypothetical protein
MRMRIVQNFGWTGSVRIKQNADEIVRKSNVILMDVDENCPKLWLDRLSPHQAKCGRNSPQKSCDLNGCGQELSTILRTLGLNHGEP